MIAVGGHLFIMSGDLSRLACDAWLLPTDDDFRISKSFAKSAHVEPNQCLTGHTWTGDQRVQPLNEWAPGKPWVWLGRVGRYGQPASWYAECGAEFIEQASARLRARVPALDRRPLLAVNVLGTGEGGMQADKGEIHLALIPVLAQAAQEFDTDVVLVTWGHRAHAAAQWARNHYLEDQLGGDG